MNTHNQRELVELLDNDQRNNLQFYEYLEYLHNKDKRFGFYGYYDHHKLVAVQYFSPLNTGISLMDKHYLSLLKQHLIKTSSTYLFGKADILSLLGDMPNRQKYPYCYGYLSKTNQSPLPINSPVNQATFDNIPAIEEFYADKDIMIEVQERLPNIIRNGSAFIVKEGSKVVSIAMAHSETSQYALIGGIYTDEDSRGKGYGLACTRALTDHLHNKQRTPFLFYDATLPHLHLFYQALGFKLTDEYVLLY
ncbi:GNAT family N-acetyltransferase [Sutcliffiella horikoshii]|uniref:GNAT family N-acetyltransferase n=1 Tax=Sutcliffiella horikoshii TaxID=79883 RepID=UPI001CFF085E|nr:GNAT family N-acetyltransferase [Sutcliffiella horikoshii]